VRGSREKASRRKALKKALISAGSLLAYAFTGGLAMLPLMLLALMRRSREEEVAVGYNMIASCLIAGVIMAVAKPLAFWIMGWSGVKYDASYDVYYVDKDNNGAYTPGGQGVQGDPAIPAAMYDMVSKVFDLVMYLGLVIMVIGLIMAGINLARRPKHASAAPYQRSTAEAPSRKIRKS